MDLRLTDGLKNDQFVTQNSQKTRKALKDTALMEKILIRELEIAPR